MTVAYASWDFNGRPGYKDLDGLVLIDGGLLGSFSTPDLAATKKAIKALDTNGPFVDLLGLKLPVGGRRLQPRVGALAVLKEPTAPAIAQSFPLLPAQFKPPIPATNRGLFGYAFDASTSPAALALIHVQAGHAGAQRRLGRRRGDADRAPGADLRPGARQRERVVLPGQAQHRRRRRQRPQAQRPDRLPQAAPVAPPRASTFRSTPCRPT